MASIMLDPWRLIFLYAFYTNLSDFDYHIYWLIEFHFSSVLKEYLLCAKYCTFVLRDTSKHNAQRKRTCMNRNFSARNHFKLTILATMSLRCSTNGAFAWLRQYVHTDEKRHNSQSDYFFYKKAKMWLAPRIASYRILLLCILCTRIISVPL